MLRDEDVVQHQVVIDNVLICCCQRWTVQCHSSGLMQQAPRDVMLFCI